MVWSVTEMAVLLERFSDVGDQPSSASAPAAKDILRAYATAQPVEELSTAKANIVLTVLLREQSGDPNATLDTPFALVVVCISDRVAKGPAWTLVESCGVPHKETFKSVSVYTDV